MHSTFVDTLTTRKDSNFRIAERVGAVVFITGLTAAAAQISLPLPLTPVPLTLQPMVVLVGAAALGSRLGLASQMLYLAVGIAGLPVFAWSPTLPQGAARLIGPTGGYLLAYPLAAFVTGWLAERGFDRRYVTALLAMLSGLAVIYAGGVSWLMLSATRLALPAALAAGFYPFILADLTKLLFASGVMPMLWKLTGRAHQQRPLRRGRTNK